jgi:hypothetical protein
MYASSSGTDDVTSYAVHRPDGNWSLMLVNRNETEPHAVRIVFTDGKGDRGFRGPVTMVTFGSEQYVWKEKHADPDGPPVTRVVEGESYVLPKASVSVLRGKM